jgi:GTP-binding protein HflX
MQTITNAIIKACDKKGLSYRMKEKETAILVGCIFQHQIEEQVESSLLELSLLTETAQAEAIMTITQKRERKDSSFYIGKGKMEEIGRVAEELDVDMIIFNDELSPSQLKNLELNLPCKVIDRTQLILDIFALRARSKEGQLQVELAQYRYLLPRIVGRGKTLSRLGGGIGTRGPGETKLEVERRHIRRRMNEIETTLEKIVSHRERYRERRKKNNVWQVALVGYTNAGKSTLLNQLTGADTYVENQLFATLDPTTKQIRLPSGIEILMSDTVGFIQDLPTTLIAAFRSTLEEVKEADLILHVIDSQDSQYQEQIDVVERLIGDLGAGHVSVVKVFNKKDLASVKDLLVGKDDLYVSAFNQEDLERIKQRVEKEIKSTMIKYDLIIPGHESTLMAQCRQQGFVEEQEWEDKLDGYRMKVYLPHHHTLQEQLTPYKATMFSQRGE